MVLTGILIEKGKLVRPVRGITIAGNFQKLLQKVNGVANDVTFLWQSGRADSSDCRYRCQRHVKSVKNMICILSESGSLWYHKEQK